MNKLNMVFTNKIKLLKAREVFVTLVILPCLLILVTELIQRESIFAVLKWVGVHTKEFFVCYMFVASILSFAVAFIRKSRVVFFLLLSLFSIASLISNIKQKFRGEPLLPWDFTLGKEATNISGDFLQVLSFKIFFLILLVFVLVFVLYHKLPKGQYIGKLRIPARIGLCVVAVILFSSIYSDKPIPIKSKLGLRCITWDQSMNCDTNGLFLAFIMNLKWISIEPPADYSQERISEIIDSFAHEKKSPNQVKPNIIMIMSEAFWDPTVMSEVSFSKDPLPFFHNLQKEHTSGSLLVPVFAGGTGNTEFEVLTGHSTQFLPAGALAYAQYVRKPVESLASILSGQGYASIAIHAYHNWFYRRDQVYQNLGFGKFISGEFFFEPACKRYYITDSEVSKKIIEETQKSEEPVFIFTVTMQNHGPYLAKNNDSGENEAVSQIQVEGDLSTQGKNILENYTQNLVDADTALEMLVKYFQESGEPTLIVFFGDHLPLLGEDHQVYREANFYQNNYDYEQYKKMFSVPYLIWSNYLTESEQLDLNATFLGPYVLQLAGRAGSVYTDYLLALSKSTPLIPKAGYLDEEGVNKSLIQDYQQLQYDLLFGNGYLYQGQNPQIIDPSYFLGSDKIQIDSVNLVLPNNEQNNEQILEIVGKNFVTGCQVYLDGKIRPTTLVDQNHLTVTLPRKRLNKSTETEIQVKLYDSLNNLIAESNCVLLHKMLK
jgi:phosphoglycerol transferase MdoB-like AlkP superfamily enzyme